MKITVKPSLADHLHYVCENDKPVALVQKDHAPLFAASLDLLEACTETLGELNEQFPHHEYSPDWVNALRGKLVASMGRIRSTPAATTKTGSLPGSPWIPSSMN